MKREETSLSSLTRRESSEAKRVPTVVRLVVVEVVRAAVAAAEVVVAAEEEGAEAVRRVASTWRVVAVGPNNSELQGQTPSVWRACKGHANTDYAPPRYPLLARYPRAAPARAVGVAPRPPRAHTAHSQVSQVTQSRDCS